MESLMTARLVDDITATHANKTRESCGQVIAKRPRRPFPRRSAVRTRGRVRPYPRPAVTLSGRWSWRPCRSTASRRVPRPDAMFRPASRTHPTDK